jgi:hypothetical protein
MQEQLQAARASDKKKTYWVWGPVWALIGVLFLYQVMFIVPFFTSPLGLPITEVYRVLYIFVFVYIAAGIIYAIVGAVKAPGRYKLIPLGCSLAFLGIIGFLIVSGWLNGF